MGDLNCRLDDTSRDTVLQAIENNDMKHLLKLDQVKYESHHEKNCLRGLWLGKT